MTRMTRFSRRMWRQVLPGAAVCAMIGCAFVLTSAVPASGSPKRLAGQGTQGSALTAKGTTSPSSSKSSASSKSASSRKSTRKHHARSRREPTQKAPTPDRIREIQSALERDGYYQGEPNGKWDSHTVDAMGRFQQEHGLNASGKLDALSLQKLGLGSQIAGVSAPQPPMAASPEPAAPAVPATPKSPEP